MQQKPNILYIHSHDSGRYVQPYGYNINTPNIQELAEDGVLFRKAFSGAPQCCPSRAALLTGQAAHSCGQFGLVNRGFELRDRHKHIANYLKELFYSTQLIGVQHEVWDPITCGYMDWINPIDWKKPKPIEEMDHDTALNAAKFLLDSPSKPFFLSVGFASTHRDFSTKNILDDPRLKDICKSMREKLMNWMLETNDPLLDGPIPIPQNSFVCDKNDFSPYDIWDRVEKPDGYA